MNVEFITSLGDYCLSKKQKIFTLALEDKLRYRACREIVKFSTNRYIKRVEPLDSKIMWRINVPKPAFVHVTNEVNVQGLLTG